MTLHPKMKKAVDEAMNKLKSLSDKDFFELIKQHQNGDLAMILQQAMYDPYEWHMVRDLYPPENTQVEVWFSNLKTREILEYKNGTWIKERFFNQPDGNPMPIEYFQVLEKDYWKYLSPPPF